MNIVIVFEAEDIYYSFGRTIKINEENLKDLDNAYINSGKEIIRKMLRNIY